MNNGSTEVTGFYSIKTKPIFSTDCYNFLIIRGEDVMYNDKHKAPIATTDRRHANNHDSRLATNMEAIVVDKERNKVLVKTIYKRGGKYYLLRKKTTYEIEPEFYCFFPK